MLEILEILDRNLQIPATIFPEFNGTA